MLVRDSEGNEHSTHFAMENEFIADYSSFLQEKETRVRLEALEETEAVILPRNAIEWGDHIKEGQKLAQIDSGALFYLPRLSHQQSVCTDCEGAL